MWRAALQEGLPAMHCTRRTEIRPQCTRIAAPVRRLGVWKQHRSICNDQDRAADVNS